LGRRIPGLGPFPSHDIRAIFCHIGFQSHFAKLCTVIGAENHILWNITRVRGTPILAICGVRINTFGVLLSMLQWLTKQIGLDSTGVHFQSDRATSFILHLHNSKTHLDNSKTLTLTTKNLTLTTAKLLFNITVAHSTYWYDELKLLPANCPQNVTCDITEGVQSVICDIIVGDIKV
jgi:hypothetical protein